MWEALCGCWAELSPNTHRIAADDNKAYLDRSVGETFRVCHRQCHCSVSKEIGRGRNLTASSPLEQELGVNPFPAWREKTLFRIFPHGWDSNREISVPTGGCPNLAI